MNGLEDSISPFRVLLKNVSDGISSKELDEMKFLLKEHVSERRREAAGSCLQLFDLLEKAGLLTDRRTDLLRNVLDQLPRRDLVQLLDGYGNHRKGFAVPACPRTTPPPTQESNRQTCMAGTAYTQPHLQEEGKSFHLPTLVQSAEQTLSCQTLFNGLPNAVATDGPTDQLSPSVIDTKQNTTRDNLHPANPTMGNYREKVLRIKEHKVQPKPHNYLEVGGYRVTIVGGRHYEIDEEEFVELNHGSTYRIKLTNSHPRSCDAQLSIDGKDVGTWRLDPKQEIELERPEDEQMCFTFFSTRMAPAEADITRGSEENGLVEVTFTPEKVREEMKTTAKDPYRGGEQGTEDDTTSSDSSGEEDEPFRSAMPQNWSSGATALQGVSGQEFEEVEGDMERDEDRQVVLMLRLVARTDAPQVKVSTAPVKPLRSKRPRALPD